MKSRSLLVVAAPAEAASVFRGLGGPLGAADTLWARVEIPRRELDVVVTGVGKAAAAGAVARALQPQRHTQVLSLGIGGSLPAAFETPGLYEPLPIGAVVLGEASVYADEGVCTPDGFVDLAEMGFPIGDAGGGEPWLPMGVRGDAGLLGTLGPVADAAGAIATVSSCSGTDSAAREIGLRTGAVVEAMEGAAVGHAVARIARIEGVAVRFAEVRVVSNSTGDRASQVWDMRAALERLERLAGEIAARLAGAD